MIHTTLRRFAALLPLLYATTGMGVQAETPDPGALRLEVLNDCIDECGFPTFETTRDAVDWLGAQAAAFGPGAGAPAGAGGRRKARTVRPVSVLGSVSA